MSEQVLIPTFKANLILRGKIECLTGTHVGGSKEKMEIGGVDSIVVRTPRSDYPYIPGSSLKGKMRHLLEYILGGVGEPVFQKENEKETEIYGRVSRKKEIVRIFGAGASEREIAKNQLNNIGLMRLVVRDAMPDEETIEMWESLGSDAHFTEYKAENTLDRLTSAANPRFIERVVEGSKFDFEMVYSVFAIGDTYVADTNADLKNVLMGLRLLEASAIGKSGSRGYGKIKFHLADPAWVHHPDYRDGTDNWKNSRAELPERLQTLEEIDFAAIEYQPHEV